jgi:hypothetical protein
VRRDDDGAGRPHRHHGPAEPAASGPARDPIDVIIDQCLALGVADVELVTVFPQGVPEVVNGGRFGQPPAALTPSTPGRGRRCASGASRSRWMVFATSAPGSSGLA